MLSPRQSLLFIVGVLFLAYVLFQGRYLILGPGIKITSHEDGAIATTSAITLSGTARNAAWLTLNSRQIFTDEKGAWKEKLILSEGQSIITVRVRDRFGREAEESLRLLRY
jgi:hypothetical protein